MAWELQTSSLFDLTLFSIQQRSSCRKVKQRAKLIWDPDRAAAASDSPGSAYILQHTQLDNLKQGKLFKLLQHAHLQAALHPNPTTSPSFHLMLWLHQRHICCHWCLFCSALCSQLFFSTGNTCSTLSPSLWRNMSSQCSRKYMNLNAWKLGLLSKKKTRLHQLTWNLLNAITLNDSCSCISHVCSCIWRFERLAVKHFASLSKY